jgi:hypothetical protein
MGAVRQDYQGVLCWRLGRMVTGRTAENALATKAKASRLAVLPVWLWLPPKQDMGRKGQGLAPIQVNYQGGPVVLSSSGSEAERVEWTAVGAGWDIGSQLTVGASGEPAPNPSPTRSPNELPASVQAEHLGVEGVRLRLQALAEDGQAARWELVEELSSMALKYVWRARSAALASLHPRADGMLEQLFSTEDVQAAADELVLGADGRRSRVDSLLERCLQPRTFERVDPLRYIATSLRCSARQMVNRRLGDPDIGAQVRRLADQLELPTHRELTEEEIHLVKKSYLVHRPSSRLGKARIAAATRPRLISSLAVRPGDEPPSPSVEHVPSIIDQIVGACKAEGGDLLAEVAQCWLSRTAIGDQPTNKDLADELWLDQRQVGWLVTQAREIAARLINQGDAA